MSNDEEQRGVRAEDLQPIDKLLRSIQQEIGKRAYQQALNEAKEVVARLEMVCKLVRDSDE